MYVSNGVTGRFLSAGKHLMALAGYLTNLSFIVQSIESFEIDQPRLAFIYPHSRSRLAQQSSAPSNGTPYS